MAINWAAVAKSRTTTTRDWDAYAKSRGFVRPIDTVEPELSAPQEQPNGFLNVLKTAARDQYDVAAPAFTPEGFITETPRVNFKVNEEDGAIANWIPKAFNAASDTIIGSIVQGFNATFEAEKALASNASGAEKVGKSLHAVTSAAGVVFSPISSIFTAGEQVPVLGTAFKGINWGFEAIAKIGSWSGETAIKAAPFLSEDAKEHLVTPFGELTALVAQVVAAHKAGKVTKVYAEKISDGAVKMAEKINAEIDAQIKVETMKGTVINPTVARMIAERAIKDIKYEKPTFTKVVEPQVVSKKPASPFVTKTTEGIISEIEQANTPEFSKKSEKYAGQQKKVSTTMLEERANRPETPKVVRKAFNRVLSRYDEVQSKSELIDLIREETGVKKVEMTPEEVKATPTVDEGAIMKPEPIAAPAVETVSPVKHTIKSGAKESTPEPNLPRPPKISVDLINKSVEKGVVKANDVKLENVDRMDMADQAKQAKEFMQKDINEALEVAMGRKNAPGNLRAETVWKAMAEYAKNTGDSRMVADLALKSTVPKTSVELGQRIKALDYGDTKTDPVSIIKRVAEAREAALNKRYKKDAPQKLKAKEAKNIDKAIEKTKPKAKDWTDFVDSIIC